MSLIDFADSITPEDMAEWNQAIASESTEKSDGAKKKKKTKP